MAENIFGPVMVFLQGKKFKLKPKLVDPVFVEIPPEILTWNSDAIIVVCQWVGLPCFNFMQYYINYSEINALLQC